MGASGDRANEPGGHEAGLRAWEAKTFAFLDAQGFDPKGGTVLLAVSGGADSTALAHFWARRGAAHFGCRVLAAHIHHGLRLVDGGAAADQRFVETLCRELGHPLFTHALNPALRRTRESVEMWARRERYAFLEDVAVRNASGWILTAHHRDDLVETVFQRLGRGTGPGGLRGIPFRRRGGAATVIHPFLNRSRAEILDYLGMAKVTWREDESNADLSIERNWYRHRYLASLRRREPELDARIFTMAMRMQKIGAAGLEALEAEARLLRRDSRGRFFLSIRPLEEKIAGRDLDSLRFWLQKLMRAASPVGRGGPGGAGKKDAFLTVDLLLEFCRQWRNSPDHLLVPVAPDLALKREESAVYCVHFDFRPSAAARDVGIDTPNGFTEQPIALPGPNPETRAWRWGDRAYRLTARIYPKPSKLAFPASSEARALFDAACFSCTLIVRTRKNGDLFSPFGIKSRTRKLKTFFNEEKVPIRVRGRYPVVAAGDTLAWVPGYGLSEFFKVGEDTTQILELALECRDL